MAVFPLCIPAARRLTRGVQMRRPVRKQPTRIANRPVDGLQALRREVVLLRQMPEGPQERRIRDALMTENDSEATEHGSGVVDDAFQAVVGEPEPLLQEVHLRHRIRGERRAPALAGRLFRFLVPSARLSPGRPEGKG
jgi:hypothetical protein